MSPEEQRIAIAKACGYSEIRYDWVDGSSSIKDFLHSKGRGIPDYLNNLDVMHEAEKHLTERQRGDYEVLLRETVCGKAGFWYTPHQGEVFAIVHATASQRAEAFLRTLGLWKD